MRETEISTMWLTYAWDDDKQGDFSYLVQELAQVGVVAKYDKIALIPGQRLWDQIGENITRGKLDGWGYLITPASLRSEPCREELAYALGRALDKNGPGFPLIGLLLGVRIENLPPALRCRLLVSLASPDWKEQTKAGLEKRPPNVSQPQQSQYVWSLRPNFGGDANAMAVEVRPRFGERMFWRFVVPATARVMAWGYGPAGGNAFSVNTTMGREGFGEMNGKPARFFGSGDKLTPGISAYVVFEGQLPDEVFFGMAAEPFGEPGELEGIKLG